MTDLHLVQEPATGAERYAASLARLHALIDTIWFASATEADR